MLITPQEVAINSSGTLTEAQLKKIRRKGVVQLIAGICFLILVPVSVLMANINWGIILIIWVLAGLFFAGVFLWSAKGYLSMKADGHTILSVSGPVKIKNSGSKHVLVTVNERSFLLMKNESATLRTDEPYTLFYMEDPKILVGWIRQEQSTATE